MLTNVSEGTDICTHDGLTRCKQPDVEDDVLHAIVSMCTKRIVIRLRLRSLKTKQRSIKPTIQHTLRLVIECLQRSSKGRNDQRNKDLDMFIENARLVIRSVDDWVNHQTVVQLKRLVVSVYNMKRIVDLEAVLCGITSKEMDPSIRKSLVNIIQKVARYCEIARCLFRMSKKHALFRHMMIRIIELPAQAYIRPQENRHTSTLASAIARSHQSYRRENVAHIRRLIGETNADIDEEFSGQVRKTLTESKVHAEIQLLYHLEIYPSSLPPRIIASSKDACFLCNAFILMHGKMHTARTHGRLYPGWRLPSIPTYLSLEQRFNELLASQIHTSLSALLSRGRKTIYPCPNESTLLDLPYSTSTLHSTLVAHKAKKQLIKDKSSAVSCLETREELESAQTIAECSEESSEVDSIVSGCLTEISIERSNMKGVTRSSHSVAAIVPSQASKEVEILHGHTIAPDKNVRLYKASNLHLYLDFPSGNVDLQHDETAKNVNYTLSWLHDADIAQLDSKVKPIHVEEMDDESTHDIGDQGYFLIAANGVVVRITVSIAR